MKDSADRPGLPWVWGATDHEVRDGYGCDAVVGDGALRLLRAVGVAAPAEHVFDWLGNLRLAPYSYDRLDNWGRRSPRRLASELPPQQVGDTVMTMFTTIAVDPGRELTIRSHPGPGRVLFGDVVVTYAVRPQASGSRLVAVLRFAGGRTPWSLGRRWALAWGDLVMMRKQLTTLAQLAEGRAAGPAGG